MCMLIHNHFLFRFVFYVMNALAWLSFHVSLLEERPTHLLFQNTSKKDTLRTKPGRIFPCSEA